MGVRVGVRPLRWCDQLAGDAAGLHVLPRVAGDVEEGVVGIVHMVLAVHDHADHVGLAQPAHQLGAFAQRRRGPALLGQVPEHGVGPLRAAVLVAGVGHRSDPQPARFPGPAVRHAHHHVGDHLPGAQRDRDRDVARLERGAVVVHHGGGDRPGDHFLLVEAENLAGRRVGPEDQAVGVVVDDALGQGLEQGLVTLLRRGQLRGKRLLLPPVADLLGHVAQLQQHAVGPPVRAAHRLVKARNENLFGRSLAPADEQLVLITLEWLTGLQHAGDQFGPALRREFRECLPDRPAEQVLAADEPAVRVVGELEDEIRPGHIGYRHRNTGEQLAQHHQPGAGTAPP
jgi:hypothetical protein